MTGVAAYSHQPPWIHVHFHFLLNSAGKQRRMFELLKQLMPWLTSNKTSEKPRASLNMEVVRGEMKWHNALAERNGRGRYLISEAGGCWCCLVHQNTNQACSQDFVAATNTAIKLKERERGILRIIERLRSFIRTSVIFADNNDKRSGFCMGSWGDDSFINSSSDVQLNVCKLIADDQLWYSVRSLASHAGVQVRQGCLREVVKWEQRK